MHKCKNDNLFSKYNINIDVLAQVLIFISLFVILVDPSIYNQLLPLLVLFLIVKIKKFNFKINFTKLDIILLVVYITFFLSFFYKVENNLEFKEYIRFLKIFMTFMLILRFKFIKIKNFFIYFFIIVSIYGLVKIQFFPNYYGGTRIFPYMRWLMDSSLVSMISYIFGLILFFKGKAKEKIIGIFIMFISIWLIINVSVRATFVSFFIINIITLINELSLSTNKIKLLKYIFCFSLAITVSFQFFPNNIKKITIDRTKSIVNLNDNRSNIYRVEVLKSSLEKFKNSIFDAEGYGNYRHINFMHKGRQITLVHSHNEIIQFLVEVGMLGLIPWITFKLYMFYILVKKRSEILGCFALLLFINLEVHNLFDLYIYNSSRRGAYIYTYIILGIILTTLKKDNYFIGNTDKEKEVD